jgi:hypothetical protein
MTVGGRGAIDQGSYDNDLASTLDDYLVEIPQSGNNVEDHQRLG